MRVMTIFVFYVSAQLPNIEYFDVYGGLWPREVSHLFSPEISRRMRQNHVWGPIFFPRYDFFDIVFFGVVWFVWFLLFVMFV